MLGRWKRRSFGICSAPEVFQHGIHELIEGLHGTEVIAGDFAVVGFGDTLDEATFVMTRIWMYCSCNAWNEGSDSIWTSYNSGSKWHLLEM